MAQLISHPQVQRVRDNLARLREEVEAARARGGDRASDREVEILAATKYVAVQSRS